MKRQNCCICNVVIYGYGHNPRPIKDKGECCDNCYFRWVTPAQIRLFKKKQMKVKAK